MSKTYSNVPKSERGGYDFWGRRHGSGHWPMGGWAKKKIRKIERVRAKEMLRRSALEEVANLPALTVSEELLIPWEGK